MDKVLDKLNSVSLILIGLVLYYHVYSIMITLFSGVEPSLVIFHSVLFLIAFISGTFLIVVGGITLNKDWQDRIFNRCTEPKCNCFICDGK